MRKPCCDKQEMNKGAWSKQEDQKLIDYINKHGEGCWRTLPQAAGLLRCGKSCRLRWINYLRPDLKRGNFAEDEEDLIIKLHALLGNRWSLIAGRLPGRTDNEVKNYWNSHLRRKLINMGVDPNNHRLSGKFSSLHNHHHHRHQNQTMSGTSITSSGLKQNIDNNVIISKKKDNDFNDEAAKGDHDHHQVGVFGEINNYEQVVSDAASGLEDESNGGGCLPDLNLDLTISIPNSSSLSIPNTDNSAIHHGEEIKQNPIHHHHHEYSKSSSRDQIHFASSPTLVLFQ